MALRTGALLGAFCVQACFALGCLAQAKIESRTVSVPTAKEQELIASFHERALDSINDKELLEHLERAKATKQPFLIIAAMSRACDWVRYGPGGAEERDERMAKVAPLVDRCLSSKEPFERLTGAMALLVLEENERLEKELATDSTFLLVRPEPVPGVDIFSAPTPGEAREVTEKRFRALMAVSAVADTRNKVIEMCGRLKVRAAEKHLEAIAADSHGQLVKQTAEAARAAITMIEKGAPTEGRPGKQPLEAIPPPEPEARHDAPVGRLSGRGKIMMPRDLEVEIEIQLKGTQARTSGRTVEPLTPKEEKLKSAIRDAGDQCEIEELDRLGETAIASGHPYVIIFALEVIARCSNSRRGVPADRKARQPVSSPLIERCLSSNDAFERMAGVNALFVGHDQARLISELERDSSFLLSRPDPPRSSGLIETHKRYRALDTSLSPLVEVIRRREEMIRLSGLFKLDAVRSNLEAIALDPGSNDYSRAGHMARRAIAKIDGQVPPVPQFRSPIED